MRSNAQAPMVYAAVTSDSAKAEWITKRAVEIVTKLQLEKKIHIAGKAAVNPELPAEKLLEKPKLPTLNALAAGGTDGLHPVVPDALAQQWAGRADWLKLLDEIYEEFGPAPTASPEEDGKERASKRRRTETQTTGVETKIQAQPPRELYDADGVLEAGVLVQCPLMNAKRSDVKLVIKQQHQIFLVNQSGNDVKLSAGLILAGFGKGSSSFCPRTERSQGLRWSIGVTPETSVVFNGKLQTLKSLVDKKRVQNPKRPRCATTTSSSRSPSQTTRGHVCWRRKTSAWPSHRRR